MAASAALCRNINQGFFFPRRGEVPLLQEFVTVSLTRLFLTTEPPRLLLRVTSPVGLPKSFILGYAWFTHALTIYGLLTVKNGKKNITLSLKIRTSSIKLKVVLHY